MHTQVVNSWDQIFIITLCTYSSVAYLYDNDNDNDNKI